MGKMKIRCLVCGQSSEVTDAQMDTQSEYHCPVCKVNMSRSQWRNIRTAYFLASSIDRRVSAMIEGNEYSSAEIRLFESEYFFDHEMAEEAYLSGNI